MSIPLIDIQAQRKALGPELGEALNRVLERGDFIQGQEVREFEIALADYLKVGHAVTCANGTDALTLVGMAENLKPGDAVFMPVMTFVATAEAFLLLGATPYFVDVDARTFNMDVESLKAGIVDAKSKGLNPKMVVAVDLFGQPADYTVLEPVVRKEGMVLVSDAAQGIGARLNDKFVCDYVDYTTTSFFPAKPLGCYGDGGAVLCNDASKAALIKSLSQHGKGSEKYDNVRVGLNSRLDTLQAAVLLLKLKIFQKETAERNAVAARYDTALRDVVETPFVMQGMVSTWAQYTIKVENQTEMQAHLKRKGIQAGIYYPLPLNRQTGYLKCPVVPGGVPVSSDLTQKVLSIPMHAYMSEETQNIIIKAVREIA